MDLAVELQKIYDSEINIEIGWVWDAGINVRLGDRVNGYLAEENVKSVSDILPWLQEAIAHFYPESRYAASLNLNVEVRTRAARRVFFPPRTGARVFCPHCGAPHASPGLDELIAFHCPRCGNFVKVEPPKIQ
jgi:predicted RNA-binding Zn-ribbon protein involved in translation (DUF1610 family)